MSLSLPRRPDMRQFFGAVRFSPLMLIVVAALAGLVAIAAAFAAYAILAPDPGPPASASIDWKAPRPSTEDLGEPRLASSDTQILSRPIFNKDRRPVTKSATAAVTAPTGPVSDTPTGLKVSAIVKHNRESRAFVSGANGQGAWKTVGEKVDEWTISEIAQEQLIVTNGVTTARLELYSDKPAPEDPLAAQKAQAPNPGMEQLDPADDADKDAPAPPPGTPAPPQPPQPGGQPPGGAEPEERRGMMRREP